MGPLPDKQTTKQDASEGGISAVCSKDGDRMMQIFVISLQTDSLSTVKEGYQILLSRLNHLRQAINHCVDWLSDYLIS